MVFSRFINLFFNFVVGSAGMLLYVGCLSNSSAFYTFFCVHHHHEHSLACNQDHPGVIFSQLLSSFLFFLGDVGSGGMCLLQDSLHLTSHFASSCLDCWPTCSTVIMYSPMDGHLRTTATFGLWASKGTLASVNELLDIFHTHTVSVNWVC